MDSFQFLRRRTTDLLSAVGDSIPPLSSLQAGNTTLKGTWERISVPPLPRSSHSVDVVGGAAYVFGGEMAPRQPVDNDMHAVVLPASGAPADYYAIKAKPAGAAPATAATAPPAAADESKGVLSDIPLDAEEGTTKVDKGKGREEPTAALGDVPAPRVGHATGVIGNRIFLFGGRAGPESKPLDEHGRVWVFDTRTQKWSYLDPAEPVAPGAASLSAVPAPRSYHCSATSDKPRDFSRGAHHHHTKATTKVGAWRDWALGTETEAIGTPQDPIVGSIADRARDVDADGYGTFIIHGGCLDEGRASDVWAFDVHSRVWQKLPDAPGKPRGGASLALSNGRLYRFGGFDGEREEGGQLDFLELGVDTFNDAVSAGEVSLVARGAWQSLLQGQENVGYKEEDNAATPRAGDDQWPGPRSVASMHAVTVGGGHEYLLVALGEGQQSGVGHEGAGRHWDDVWAFQVPQSGMSALAVKDSVLSVVGRKNAGGKWTKVEMGPYDDEDDASVPGPGPRGWLASGVVTDLEDNGVVIWGGLNDDNKRMGDGWILRLG